jgi:UDP-glucose 4-epimerase
MIPERILVTGGAGFIGSHTVDLLLRQGKQVLVLDNLSSGKITNLNLQHPNLEFIEGDVLEYPLMVDLLNSCDAVLHLAAIASVPQSIDNPIYTFQVNTQGLLHILEAVRQVKRDIRVVYASSAAVYGDAKDLPCRDDLPLASVPLSPYALQKVNDEQYADLYSRLHGVQSLGLRYFNVYGLGQDPQSTYSGVISRFLDAYQKDTEMTVFGDGQQSRDFIYVTDVARANLLALQGEYQGVLNIATGQAQTLLKLIECMQSAGKKPASFTLAPPRVGDIKTSYAAITKAKQAIDFSHTVSIDAGIALLLQA